MLLRSGVTSVFGIQSQVDFRLFSYRWRVFVDLIENKTIKEIFKTSRGSCHFILDLISILYFHTYNVHV